MSLLIRQGLWYVLGGNVVNFLNLLFWVIYARYITIVDLDKFTLAISFGALISFLSTLATDYALLKLVPEDREYIGCAFTFHLILQIFIMITLIILYYRVQLIFSNLSFNFFILSLIYAVLLSFRSVLNFSVIALAKTQYSTFSLFIMTILKILIPLLFMAYLTLNGYTLLISVIIAQAFSVLFLIYVLSKVTRLITKLNIKYIVNIWKYSIINAPNRTFRTILYYMAPYILSLMGCKRGDLSALFISLTIILALLSLPGSIALVALPVSAYQDKRRTLALTARYAIGLALLVTCIALCIPKFLIYLIKPQLINKAYILKDLSIMVLLEAIILSTVTIWNREERVLNLSIAGLIQLSTFIVVTTIVALLSSLSSSSVIIIALLSSLTVTVIYMLLFEKSITRIALKGLFIYMVIYVVDRLLRTFLSPLPIWIILIIIILLTLFLLHLLRILSINEFINLIKIVITKIKQISS